MSNQPQTGWTGESTIDWSGISTEAPPPLEPGVYQAEVVKAEVRTTKGGDPSINLRYRVFGRFGSDEKLKRPIFDTLVFTIDGAFKAKQLAEVLGIQLPSTINNATLEDLCHELNGASPWMRTKLDTYEGKTNARIDVYLTEEQCAEAAEALKAHTNGAGESAGGNRRRRG